MQLAVLSDSFPDAAEGISFARLLPFAPGHVPLQSESLDWILADLRNIYGAGRGSTIADAIRILRPHGVLLLRLHSQDVAEDAFLLREELISLPGAKLRCFIAPTDQSQSTSSVTECYVGIVRLQRAVERLSSGAERTP